MTWQGTDYVERQAVLWHNRLVDIILYGIDARGAENLEKARTDLPRLLEQRVPGNQRHMVARRWQNKKASLARMWKEAIEVAEGRRRPKLAAKRDLSRARRPRTLGRMASRRPSVKKLVEKLKRARDSGWEKDRAGHSHASELGKHRKSGWPFGSHAAHVKAGKKAARTRKRNAAKKGRRGSFRGRRS